MKLKVINSGSRGNCYILAASSGEKLILEAGVNFKEIQAALDFDLKNVSGVLVSHKHKDHSLCVDKCLKAGLNVYMNQENFDETKSGFKILNGVTYEERNLFHVGNFSVFPLAMKHDVQCFGFLISHEESGLILFATDTYFINYDLTSLNLKHLIVESNYTEEKLHLEEYVSQRVRRSHLSIESLEKIIETRITAPEILTCTLIHLSDSRSDEIGFKKRISQMMPFASVEVANPGVEVELLKTQF